MIGSAMLGAALAVICMGQSNMSDFAGGICGAVVQKLENQTGETVYVHHGSHGGNPIANWLSGPTWAADALAARDAMPADATTIYIWMQGEKDRKTEEDAGAYKAQEEDLMAYLRTPYPGFWVSIGIGTTDRWAWKINRAKAGIADDCDTYYLPPGQAPMEDDGVHFTTEGRWWIGKQAANAYLRKRFQGCP